MNGAAPECQHAHIIEETITHEQARWVPSWDENYDENDPQETVTLTDYKVTCTDCGEVIDGGPASGY